MHSLGIQILYWPEIFGRTPKNEHISLESLRVAGSIELYRQSLDPSILLGEVLHVLVSTPE
ncbi:predicted protein [Botrytis cinerea T4]|uniref:Uncharacterized protein n=1 Tax=Botryotinia fuckeliana (strain T4) TaxID=999810 RepID=G2XUX4_BOTF4|nr:predicted protein [Botrytis cinerea T4]